MSFSYGTNKVDVAISKEQIWEFVHGMNNWTPLVPGFITHNIINENESTCKFKGDLGFMKKTVKLKIDIRKWNEPISVLFDLKGTSDNFKGGGHFIAHPIDENNKTMEDYLDITASVQWDQWLTYSLRTSCQKLHKSLLITSLLN